MTSITPITRISQKQYVLREQLEHNRKQVDVCPIFTEAPLPEKVELPDWHPLKHLKSAVVLGARIPDDGRDNIHPPTVRLASPYFSASIDKQPVRTLSRYHVTLIQEKNGNETVSCIDGVLIYVDPKSGRAYMIGTKNEFNNPEQLMQQALGKGSLTQSKFRGEDILIRNSTNGTFSLIETRNVSDPYTKSNKTWLNIGLTPGMEASLLPEETIMLGAKPPEIYNTSIPAFPVSYIIKEDQGSGRLERVFQDTLNTDE